MLCSFFGLSFPKYAACLIDAENHAYADFDSRPFSSKGDGAIAMTVVFDITRSAFSLPHHL